MNKYHRDAAPLRFCSPSTVSAVLGGLVSALGAVLLVVAVSLYRTGAALGNLLIDFSGVVLCMGVTCLFLAGALALVLPAEDRIRYMVCRGLYHPSRGNPLHFKDGELLPMVACVPCKKQDGYRRYILKIEVKSRTIDDIKGLSSFLSSTLSGRFKCYAVTQVWGDDAHNYVAFLLEDVTADRSLVVHDVGEIKPPNPTTLLVQQGTSIDLTTSGSIIVAGKTRSGKTTGIISLLLQALQWGKDKFDSRIVIIDPKRAELSRLPGVVTVDDDGGGHAILAALKDFADLITKRQAFLNEMSEETGDAVHWWAAKMHPCLLFLDEFVACRTLFPKRADKDDPTYSLAEFDAILKRIVTMGASAGCYVIVSIAEASVEEGGLPSMLRSAMSTKILFRPTMPEARLLWGADKLEAVMDKGYYGPGEAWFSSTDGAHDDVTCVHFPQLEFPAYRELGTLLRLYGGDD